jgi:hypothetical protein
MKGNVDGENTRGESDQHDTHGTHKQNRAMVEHLNLLRKSTGDLPRTVFVPGDQRDEFRFGPGTDWLGFYSVAIREDDKKAAAPKDRGSLRIVRESRSRV